jgi:hypothetical protein
MPPTDDLQNVEYVSETIIREYFNNGKFYQRSLTGEFSTWMKRDSHPDSPPGNEPYCTRSQIVYYYDQDKNPVAIVHQYLRPDGTLGASGKPDPKRIFLENRIISVKTKKQ